MTKVLKKTGRPMSNPVNAKVKYLMLKDAAAKANADLRSFQKECIEKGFLTRVIEKLIPVAAHDRKQFKDIWSCD
jgi:hypothetical protein